MQMGVHAVLPAHFVVEKEFAMLNTKTGPFMPKVFT